MHHTAYIMANFMGGRGLKPTSTFLNSFCMTMCLALVPDMVMFSCSLMVWGNSLSSFFLASSASFRTFPAAAAAWVLTALAWAMAAMAAVKVGFIINEEVVTVIVGIGGRIGVTPV